jgi:hypothetical protein
MKLNIEMIDAGQARVLEIADGPPRDITHSFETIARAEFLGIATSWRP